MCAAARTLSTHACVQCKLFTSSHASTALLDASAVCLLWLAPLCMQVFVERAFTSSVRVLAADADSDVVWGGDDAGRLAVFR